MGGVISIPSVVAGLNSCKSSTSDAIGFNLSKDYQTLLAELTEIIIPKTETPGAKEAGVGEFIELMLKDCYSEVQQKHFVAGLDDVETEAKKLGNGFMELTNDKKIEVVKIMQEKAKAEADANEEKKAKQIDSESGLVKEDQKKKDQVEIPVPFFRILKELTLFGYFTSEPGATQALDFVPIPGRYDGCIKLEPGQKAYAI
jgi:hypothetical protein